jgi:hypothetical protein
MINDYLITTLIYDYLITTLIYDYLITTLVSSNLSYELSTYKGHNTTTTGADPGYQVRGGGAHLKKLRRAERKFLGYFV